MKVEAGSQADTECVVVSSEFHQRHINNNNT